ncbi:hypothetical protein R1sor_026608 [Riccia sorocarpa]|uniref:Uncharacterized protein n=1 Tax=Riccia sorocarpa TaxID=122646 RepID=A0ABD3GF57_9MARC
MARKLRIVIRSILRALPGYTMLSLGITKTGIKDSWLRQTSLGGKDYGAANTGKEIKFGSGESTDMLVAEEKMKVWDGSWRRSPTFSGAAERSGGDGESFLPTFLSPYWSSPPHPGSNRRPNPHAYGS